MHGSAGQAGREAWPGPGAASALAPVTLSRGAASALAPVTLSRGLVIWKDKPRSRVVISD